MSAFQISPRPVRLGRLRRLRVDELAEEGQAPLLDHPEHLLQLRVGVRHPRLRRQGEADRPQDRGQPAAPGQPRPHLRQGRRHAEPARGSGSDPLSAARATASADPASGRQVSWDEALDDIGGRLRKAIVENRRHEIMYHVGRPGEDGYANRVLQAWGVDGHNSHTNVCSSSARLGHFLWCGNDRPSPDYANAQTILLLSSHLETGHYFNPHAQRIIEGQANGATLIVIDPRLSNTSAKANVWMPAYSGHRRRAAARDGQRDPRRGSLRPRVHAHLGRLARLPARRAARSRRHLRQLHRRAEGALRAVHAGVRRRRDRRRRGADRRGGARHRPRARHLQHAQLAIGGRRQPVGLADHALPVPARRADRIGRHEGRRRPAPVEQVRARSTRPRRRRPTTGTSCSSRASIRSPSSR